jgi:hypothetical protein
MAGTIINGTYVSGIRLSNPNTENPLTIGASGYVTNESTVKNGPALLGTAAAAWTITNLGRVNGKANAASVGILLMAGGSVTNGASGSASGLITANLFGVEIEGKSGTVGNFGEILGFGTNGAGVVLKAGGTVVNGAGGSSSGLIEGTVTGVDIEGGAGDVTNSGTIVSLGRNGDGISLGAGGTVVNSAGGSGGGLIQGFADGVVVARGSGSVTNHGTILGSFAIGVFLEQGGAVANDGRIVGRTAGIEVDRGAGAVANSGVLAGKGIGLYLQRGGTLNNGKGARIIAIGGDAVFVTSGAATVTNSGAIIGGAGAGGAAVYLGGGGSVINGESGKALGLINGNNDGVVVNHAAGAVTNFGTILSGATGVTSAAGVVLGAGGTVINGSGKGRSHALISAKESSVYIGGVGGKPPGGAAGTVINYGTMQSTGLGTAGAPSVLLVSGGTVTNHGLIESAAASGVSFHNKAGTVTNFGSIISDSTGASGAGVYLQDGGLVTNERQGTVVGAANAGVAVTGGAGTVINLGTIDETGGTGAAVYLGGGGVVTNGRSGTALGLIDGGRVGVLFENRRGGVTNFGTIESASTLTSDGSLAGVVLRAGGSLVNGGSKATGARITAAEVGVYVAGAAGAVVNFGTIQSTGIAVVAAPGVALESGGLVTNRGLIESASGAAVEFAGKPGAVVNSGAVVGNGPGSAGVGVYLENGGRISNEAGGVISAAASAGVAVKGGGGVVFNLGTIRGGATAGGAAVYLGGGGAVTNGRGGSSGGLIESGDGSGVVLANAAANVTNFGTIRATGTLPGAGVEFSAGGALINHGLIESSADTAILFAGKPGTVTNFGLVASLSNHGGGTGIDLGDGGGVINNRDAVISGDGNAGIAVETAAATIVNNGTIESTAGNGVYLAAGGNLMNAAGARIDGAVHGVFLKNPSGTVINHGLIEGGSAGFAALGTGAETVINFGTIASTAGAGGVAYEIDGSTGGNVLIVEPGAVFVGTVRGGGESTIEFIGGGTANVSGVEGFATIVLANGVKHSLTLTAANFVDVTPGAITIEDGNRGNTVSAAGVPAPAAIIVDAGTGVDTLIGGSGNDTFFAGGRTTMTGAAGTNEFVFSAPGRNTITDFGFSLTNELVFSNSGFDLGLKNATMTPTVLPASLFTANSTGSFTNTSQRFAYDTKNGDLFFSASGTTANKQLVVVLNGAPPLTTTANSHLFYIT